MNLIKVKRIKIISSIIYIGLSFTSCYSHRTIVGTGHEKNTVQVKRNSYFIFGLIPLSNSDAIELEEDGENFTIFTQQTFVDGVISFITCGIYTPTTTVIKR